MKLRYVRHELPPLLHAIAPTVAQVMVETLRNVGFRETEVIIEPPNTDGIMNVTMTWNPEDTMEPPCWKDIE